MLVLAPGTSDYGYERTFGWAVIEVRFTLESGHNRRVAAECPLLTRSGHSLDFLVSHGIKNGIGATKEWVCSL